LSVLVSPYNHLTEHEPPFHCLGGYTRLEPPQRWSSHPGCTIPISWHLACSSASTSPPYPPSSKPSNTDPSSTSRQAFAARAPLAQHLLRAPSVHQPLQARYQIGWADGIRSALRVSSGLLGRRWKRRLLVAVLWLPPRVLYGITVGVTSSQVPV